MTHTNYAGGHNNVPNLYPGHALYEIPRGLAGPVIAAAGFIKQYDSGDFHTVLIECAPLSAAYNLIHAV